uniref:Uncharacterized protein n=1 Tax=Kalanchoe fedtschenkoi TaxID=63787 RepID=A0A7N0T2E8_KALFE
MRENSWESSFNCTDLERQSPTNKAGLKSSRDGETKRRKRVAKYHAYSVEGKLKASLRNGLRWIKQKYTALIHGY